MTPTQFYKCLADETRLLCLLLIIDEKELCVCQLMAALGESQPKISRHLALLRECDLLITQKNKQWVFYRINETLPSWCISVLQETLKNNNDFLAKNLKSLKQFNETNQLC